MLFIALYHLVSCRLRILDKIVHRFNLQFTFIGEVRGGGRRREEGGRREGGGRREEGGRRGGGDRREKGGWYTEDNPTFSHQKHAGS